MQISFPVLFSQISLNGIKGEGGSYNLLSPRELTLPIFFRARSDGTNRGQTANLQRCFCLDDLMLLFCSLYYYPSVSFLFFQNSLAQKKLGFFLPLVFPRNPFLQAIYAETFWSVLSCWRCSTVYPCSKVLQLQQTAKGSGENQKSRMRKKYPIKDAPN